MKTTRISLGLVVLGVVGWGLQAQAAVYTDTYYGNGSGYIVGNGQMTLSDSGGSALSVTFAPGYVVNGGFPEALVLYVDSQAGGFATTENILDAADGQRRAISGTTPGQTAHSLLRFAPGFEADYAIVLAPTAVSGLYRLNAGGDGSLEFLRSFSPGDNPALCQFNIYWSDLGISGDAAHSLRFQSSYTSLLGARTRESFETLTYTGNFGTLTFDYFNTFGVQPVPEPVNVALALFGGIALTVGVVNQVRHRRQLVPVLGTKLHKGPHSSSRP